MNATTVSRARLRWWRTRTPPPRHFSRGCSGTHLIMHVYVLSAVSALVATLSMSRDTPVHTTGWNKRNRRWRQNKLRTTHSVSLFISTLLRSRLQYSLKTLHYVLCRSTSRLPLVIYQHKIRLRVVDTTFMSRNYHNNSGGTGVVWRPPSAERKRK